jgi:hypothetical protein
LSPDLSASTNDEDDIKLLKKSPRCDEKRSIVNKVDQDFFCSVGGKLAFRRRQDGKTINSSPPCLKQTIDPAPAMVRSAG